MSAVKDLTGLVSGRLTVLRWNGTINLHRSHMWVCLCTCGTECVVASCNLGRVGGVRSCGCLRREIRHGDTRKGRKGKSAVEYNSWLCMRARCLNRNHPSYPQYGRRGIKICGRWTTYKLFLEDVGRKPGPDYTLDRIDVNGNYEPGNVRWATCQDQGNNRRNNVRFTVNGQTKTLAEWLRKFGMSAGCYYNRIRRSGMTPYDAITTPVKRTT